MRIAKLNNYGKMRKRKGKKIILILRNIGGVEVNTILLFFVFFSLAADFRNIKSCF